MKRKLFLNFMQTRIEALQQQERFRTADTYASALRSFKEFLCGKDLPIEKLDERLVQDYERYLLSHGLCPNSTSFYMRILQAVYHCALKNGLGKSGGMISGKSSGVHGERNFCTSPFKSVYTGVDKTIKRALSLEHLRALKNISLPQKEQAFARDLFLLSFYTRGMAFVDMAYLKKNQIRHGVLTYRRHKTGQTLHLQWEPCMQALVKCYPTPSDSPYLLPIMDMVADRKCDDISRGGARLNNAVCNDTQHKRCDALRERTHYLSALSRINRHLKTIANLLGWNFPLTTYVARHTWASVAKEQNIPLSVISEAMGHDSETTTLIYLQSLNNTLLDQANRKVIDALCK